MVRKRSKAADAEKDLLSKAFSILGKKGGPARAKTLTPERRREIAKKAAAARWKRQR